MPYRITSPISLKKKSDLSTIPVYTSMHLLLSVTGQCIPEPHLKVYSETSYIKRLHVRKRIYQLPCILRKPITIRNISNNPTASNFLIQDRWIACESCGTALRLKSRFMAVIGSQKSINEDILIFVFQVVQSSIVLHPGAKELSEIIVYIWVILRHILHLIM